MTIGKTILLLDDDSWHLQHLTEVLQGAGYLALGCLDVEAATRALEEAPSFAIVDLFLAGDSGSELSATFIEQELLSRGIAYGRMTSAPSLVPPHLRGSWVLPKSQFRQNPQILVDLLLESVPD